MIEKIRNFAIIAHIDHGKSTLADRFLEITQTVPKDKIIPQYLDQLSLEREKGITIKMQPVSMNYKGYVLNLIDTPGHIDFNYEVSRALAAVEGAILLIDGTQGIQAQTVHNLELAKKQNLVIIPAINKIDLNIKDLDSLIEGISKITLKNDIHLVSAKLGTGVEEILKAVIKDVPFPKKSKYCQALIFDSHFDSYKGIIAHVRVFGGEFRKFMNAYFKQRKQQFKILEVGLFKPEMKEIDCLSEGMIGYIATGVKDPGIVKIGDTITLDLETPALAGYQEPEPVVFASVFPSENVSFENFEDSLKKFQLNDPSIFLEKTVSPFLGKGYNVGAMGLLHLEIFEQRLKKEFGTEIILTLPSIRYKAVLKDGNEIFVFNPQEIDLSKILYFKEPFIEVEIFSLFSYAEKVFLLLRERRGKIKDQTIESNFIKIKAEMPLEELISGFYDELKSISSGYASLRWQFIDYYQSDLVKLDILIAEEKEPSLSRLIHKDKAEKVGRKILLELKENLPKEEFAIKLQAAINNRIIARETIPALKKDVAGWLYGGDRTRKMKLWQKQKEGKKKLQKLGKGKVKVPNNVLLKILRVK
jgi:GTP-binding protein LepA